MAQRLDEPGMLGRVTLWIKLSCGRVPGFSFTHDHKVAGHTIDFFCPEVGLGIDVLPSSRRASNKVDDTRLSLLEAHGVTLLTFTEDEVQRHTEDVLEHIRILAAAFKRIPRVS
jgi:very-short-patch-repair endonuclease